MWQVGTVLLPKCTGWQLTFKGAFVEALVKCKQQQVPEWLYTWSLSIAVYLWA